MNKKLRWINIIVVINILILGVVIWANMKFFNGHHCELVTGNTQDLLDEGNKTFNKIKSIKSSDNQLLIKISGHLDYVLNHEASNDLPRAQALLGQPTSSVADATGSHQQPAATSTFINQQAPATGSSVTGTVAASTAGGTTSSNGANSNLYNPSSRPLIDQNKSNSTTTHASVSTGGDDKKKRYLPIELESVKAQGKPDNLGRQNYTLNFNCTKITLTVNRKQDRVYIDNISLDLNVSNRKKSECHVTFNKPPFEIWSTEYDTLTGLGHYKCASPSLLRYRCYHNANQLLDLQLDGIQFMVARNGSQVSSKFDSNPKKQC